MVESAVAFGITPLQQNIQGLMSLILAIDLFLLITLILAFLGVTWKRDKSELGALRAGKLVLGLYIIFISINALIYVLRILQGGMLFISGGSVILDNPVLFFVFLGPPILFMYLDIRLPESSGFYASLSDSALVLLVWLIVFVVAIGFTGTIVVG